MVSIKIICSSLFCLILLGLVACTEVERSAGKALGNANSVVNSSSDTLWSKEKPDPSPSPAREKSVD